MSFNVNSVRITNDVVTHKHNIVSRALTSTAGSRLKLHSNALDNEARPNGIKFSPYLICTQDVVHCVVIRTRPAVYR